MDVLVYLTLVITLGIVSQWVAWRAHLPAILLLLISGFLLLPVYEWCSGDQKLADQGRSWLRWTWSTFRIVD